MIENAQDMKLFLVGAMARGLFALGIAWVAMGFIASEVLDDKLAGFVFTTVGAAAIGVGTTFGFDSDFLKQYALSIKSLFKSSKGVCK